MLYVIASVLALVLIFLAADDIFNHGKASAALERTRKENRKNSIKYVPKFLRPYYGKTSDDILKDMLDKEVNPFRKDELRRRIRVGRIVAPIVFTIFVFFLSLLAFIYLW